MVIISVRSVRLLVIDSLAALLRVDFSQDEHNERSRAIIQLAQFLKQLSDQYRMSIVCVNQVSDFVRDDGLFTGPRVVIPALGLLWSTMINCRFLLHRDVGGYQDGNGTPPNESLDVPLRRSFNVVMAPHLPNAHAYFRVTEQGIEDKDIAD